MRVGEVSESSRRRALRGDGLGLRTGPFSIRIRSSLPDIEQGVGVLYGDHELLGQDEFVDFRVRVDPPASHRRWLRPQVCFDFDGRAPFKPLPRSQGLPMLEWGLNWCVANHMHRYLIVHAAVLARGERALLLPGDPGAGKSTLAAALMHRGWRLLSDELALIDVQCALHPMPRPVSLKNESIDVISAFAPEATIGPRCPDTAKGTVALVKPPTASVEAALRPARAAWVVFPTFSPAAPARLDRLSRGRAFMRLITHSFNYSVLGARGFDSLGEMLDNCACFEFSYHILDEAIDAFESL